MGTEAVVIARITPDVHWHALEDDVVVGRGHALHRPDGRVFLSVDTWRDDVFEVLAEAMVADLRRPVYTVVDEDDREVLARWSSRGFLDHRREVEYVLPTAVDSTGPGADGRPPAPGTWILVAGEIDEARLLELDGRLREDIDAASGWERMPAQFVHAFADRATVDTSHYVVAVQDGDYAGLARISGPPRRPRLGLVAVRSPYRRRGLARALLAAAFRPLHERGIRQVSAEVDEANKAAIALVTGLGAIQLGTALELVRRPAPPPRPAAPPPRPATPARRVAGSTGVSDPGVAAG
jgi:ribosomal protein S18 acetylase RimI-like enzyme